MHFTLKPISIVMALAMLASGPALCQEPPSLPRLPIQEQAPELPVPESGPADTSAVGEPPAAPSGGSPAGPQEAAADSTGQPAKPAKKTLAFKPGRIVLDRNGRIFLGATAVLVGAVYLAYRVFRKGVK